MYVTEGNGQLPLAHLKVVVPVWVVDKVLRNHVQACICKSTLLLHIYYISHIKISMNFFGNLVLVRSSTLPLHISLDCLFECMPGHCVRACVCVFVCVFLCVCVCVCLFGIDYFCFQKIVTNLRISVLKSLALGSSAKSKVPNCNLTIVPNFCHRNIDPGIVPVSTG